MLLDSLGMDALVDLPEIKAEIKAEDFAAQQQQQQQQHAQLGATAVVQTQQQNCQWVSLE